MYGLSEQVCERRQGVVESLPFSFFDVSDNTYCFVGTDHLRTKIIINDKTLEQVDQFTYLGCSISYQFSNDVESKLATFLQFIHCHSRP